MTSRLGRSFFARDAETVARSLLGMVLVHRTPGGEARVRVVETEAYVGTHDLACHASKGRTKRTEVMFGEAGHAYVYLIYGMYSMLNVVTGAIGDAQAVLLRAGESVDEGRSMAGPGRLTRGLGVSLELNGLDVCGDCLFFERGRAPRRIGTSPRVGVDYAGPWKAAPLRFFDADSIAVSKGPKR